MEKPHPTQQSSYRSSYNADTIAQLAAAAAQVNTLPVEELAAMGIDTRGLVDSSDSILDEVRRSKIETALAQVEPGVRTMDLGALLTSMHLTPHNLSADEAPSDGKPVEALSPNPPLTIVPVFGTPVTADGEVQPSAPEIVA